MKALFWFRRDLRLEDNHGLFRALMDNEEVLPLFIFDSNILSKLEDKDDSRMTLIHSEISDLKKKLEAMDIEPESAELQRIPRDTVKLGDEDARKILKVIEIFEDDDDVQQVFHNLEISESMMDEM